MSSKGSSCGSGLRLTGPDSLEEEKNRILNRLDGDSDPEIFYFIQTLIRWIRYPTPKKTDLDINLNAGSGSKKYPDLPLVPVRDKSPVLHGSAREVGDCDHVLILEGFNLV